MRKYHLLVVVMILFAGIFSISSSCKRNQYCKKKAGTCRSVLEAKDFFLFKEGSWWVYEEENTHQRDSQYVYEYNNTSGYDFDMRVHSTLDGYDYHYWPKYADGAIKTCSESEPVSGKCLYVNRNKTKLGDYKGWSECFFINYKVGDYTYANSDILGQENKITIVQLFDTYNLNNVDFNFVVKIREDFSQIYDKQPANYYYSKSIGMIKLELLDSNQVWNLVDYHIES